VSRGHESAGKAAGIMMDRNGGGLKAKSGGRRWLVAAWLASFLGWAGAAADPTPPAEQPHDLTGLSLEELLHEEITPVNVLGSHTHLKQQFMIGYRYMFMDMEDNLAGSKTVSQNQVLQSYPVVHTHMAMTMHMTELMYAPTDRITVMTMIPYEEKTMNHLFRDGTRNSDSDAGVGDLSFMGLFNVLGNPRALGHRLVLNAGFTVPTGSIGEGEGGKRFEYEMQLGSGTYDLEPGLTYLGESQMFAWGAQVMGTVRLGSNEHQYRLGNAYRLSAWTQLKLTDWFGPSVRLDWHAWEDIHGADPTLDPNRNPAFDATKQSGRRLDFMAGLNLYVPGGLFKGNRFSFEGGVPVYQYLDGPNMGVNWQITAAWSYSF
jgi:hypothetical protein